VGLGRSNWWTRADADACMDRAERRRRRASRHLQQLDDAGQLSTATCCPELFVRLLYCAETPRDCQSPERCRLQTVSKTGVDSSALRRTAENRSKLSKCRSNTRLETAEALHISRDTVKRDWRFAKLWLLRSLSGERQA
jgi:hypothetical protein